MELLYEQKAQAEEIGGEKRARDTEEPKDVLARALQCLEKKEQVQMISKYGMLEYPRGGKSLKKCKKYRERKNGVRRSSAQLPKEVGEAT